MKNMDRKRLKQKGSISIFGAAAIILSMTTFYGLMEIGNKMMMQRTFDSYAQSMAPTALRHELAITQSWTGPTTMDQMNSILTSLGYTNGKDVHLTLTFGNMVALDTPKKYKDDKSGITYDIYEEFVPLAKNPSNPKAGVTSPDSLPEFSAIAVKLVSDGGIFDAFQAEGQAIYGLGQDDKDSPDIADCYCDARFNQCMDEDVKDAGTLSIMGAVGSSKRHEYCETGLAPIVQGLLLSHAKYPDRDTVRLAPQWVGKAYKENNVETDMESQAWQDVNQNLPLNIVGGTNPFPEAAWDADQEVWIHENRPVLNFNGKSLKENFNFFGLRLPPITINGQQNVEGLFYVGRSGVCAKPTSDNSSAFKSSMSQNLDSFVSFFNGNTKCLRYSKNIGSKQKFGSRISKFMVDISGANEYYYSCRDFSGIKEARGGFFQVMVRLFTRGSLDWERTYQEADCSVRKMKFFGWWVFGSWR